MYTLPPTFIQCSSQYAICVLSKLYSKLCAMLVYIFSSSNQLCELFSSHRGRRGRLGSLRTCSFPMEATLYHLTIILWGWLMMPSRAQKIHLDLVLQWASQNSSLECKTQAGSRTETNPEASKCWFCLWWIPVPRTGPGPWKELNKYSVNEWMNICA